MAYWLTENSMVPMITGAILVVILLLMSFSARDRLLAIVALTVGVLTLAIVVCEQLIVTDQEEVTATLYVLADHVSNNNADGILAYISDDHPQTAVRARNEMASVKFESCRLIGTNYFVGPKPGNEKAEICFVVAASGTSKQLGTGASNVKVKLYLKRESESNWKIIDYKRELPHAGLKL